MTRRSRRNHSPAFEGDKTLAELAHFFDVHPPLSESPLPHAHSIISGGDISFYFRDAT